jgi:uncharacterized protein with GYD domain
MQYYLVRLSYTPAAWLAQVEQARDPQKRLAAIYRLIRHFGGSVGNPRFEDEEPLQDGKAGPVDDGKFMALGTHDLISIIKMPDAETAFSFAMTLKAEPGIRNVELTPLLPMYDAIKAMSRSYDARMATGYAAPGGSSKSWNEPPTAD